MLTSSPRTCRRRRRARRHGRRGARGRPCRSPGSRAAAPPPRSTAASRRPLASRRRASPPRSRRLAAVGACEGSLPQWWAKSPASRPCSFCSTSTVPVPAGDQHVGLLSVVRIVSSYSRALRLPRWPPASTRTSRLSAIFKAARRRPQAVQARPAWTCWRRGGTPDVNAAATARSPSRRRAPPPRCRSRASSATGLLRVRHAAAEPPDASRAAARAGRRRSRRGASGRHPRRPRPGSSTWRPRRRAEPVVEAPRVEQRRLREEELLDALLQPQDGLERAASRSAGRHRRAAPATAGRSHAAAPRRRSRP